MADQGKVMGAGDLENYLKREFAENNKVNKLFEQLVKSKAEMEKETGEENPFFYGAVYNYMNSNKSKSISDWVDSKGNVNISAVSTVVKIAKKEFEQKKILEADQEKKASEAQKVEETEKTSADFSEIDFNHMTAKNFIYIAENIEQFMNEASVEQKQQVIEKVDEMAGTSKIYKMLQQAIFDPTILTNSDVLEEIKDGLLPEVYNEVFDENGFNKDNMQVILNKKIKVLGKLVERNETEELNKEIIQDTLKKYHLDVDKYSGLIDIDHILELARDGKLQEFFEQEKAQAVKNIDSMDPVSKPEETVAEGKADIGQEKADIGQAQTSETSYEEFSQDDFENFFDDMFAKAIDPALIQEENQLENNGEEQLKYDLDEREQEVQIIEEQVMAEQAIQEEISVEPENLVQDIAQEKVQAEQELKDYEMEVEEKTGLAGLFSKVKDFIQNIPAIQGLFAKTNTQERLGDGKPQVTREDGIKQTTYFGNGSLEPWTVRARNFAINLGSNVMEAIGKVAKSSNKEDKDVPINRPTIIKSQEKTNERTTEEQQIDNIELNPMQQQQMDSLKVVEQQGRKMDDNPWAINVDKNMEKEALARSANAGKSQSIDKSSSHDKPNHDDDGTIGLG